MRGFLDGLDAAPTPVPRDRRCLAALGPRMLALSAERSLGALTYFVPVEHTRFAREQMGSAALVATELACVIDDDAERARATAREYAQTYLALRNYTSNLRRFGFSEADIENGGSDRLIDAVIPHGTAAEIAAVVRAHLDAGADHVCLTAARRQRDPARAVGRARVRADRLVAAAVGRHRQQVDVEDQGRVRRDLRWTTGAPVGEIRRDDQLTPAADALADDPRHPARRSRCRCESAS